LTERFGIFPNSTRRWMLTLISLILVQTNAQANANKAGDSLESSPSALTMTQLHLKPRAGRDAKLILGNGEKSYTMEVSGDGTFEILHHENTVLRASHAEGLVVGNLVSDTITAQHFILDGIPQWKLISLETFASPKVSTSANAPGKVTLGQCSTCLKGGWSNDQTIQCSLLSILSLDPKNHTLAKIFKLGHHDQLRITATVHFIDDWQGETAYLKVDNEYLWTETVDQENGAGKLNVCGSSNYPETRFSVPIDITIPHHQSQVSLLFGATIEEGAEDTYFGISNLALYTRLLTTSKATEVNIKH